MAVLADRVGHMGLTPDDLRGLLGQVGHHLAGDALSDELVQSSSVHCCRGVHGVGLVDDDGMMGIRWEQWLLK